MWRLRRKACSSPQPAGASASQLPHSSPDISRRSNQPDGPSLGGLQAPIASLAGVALTSLPRESHERPSSLSSCTADAAEAGSSSEDRLTASASDDGESPASTRGDAGRVGPFEADWVVESVARDDGADDEQLPLPYDPWVSPRHTVCGV